MPWPYINTNQHDDLEWKSGTGTAWHLKRFNLITYINDYTFLEHWSHSNKIHSTLKKNHIFLQAFHAHNLDLLFSAIFKDNDYNVYPFFHLEQTKKPHISLKAARFIAFLENLLQRF